MHLLALLVAAVFSSSFVAPNAIPAFTVTPKSITSVQLGDTPKFVTTLASTLSGVQGYVGLTATTAIEDGHVIATTDIDDEDDKKIINAGLDLSDLDIDPIPESIFIFLLDSTGAAYEHVEVPVADAWTIAVTGGLKDTQLTKLPAFTITAGATQFGWSDTMEAKFSFTRGETAPVTVSHPITRTGAGTVGEPYVYTIAAERSLAALGILTKDFDNQGVPADVTLTVSLVLDGDDTEYPLTASLTITRATPDFVVPTAAIPEASIAAATTSIQITPPNSGTTWDTKTVTAVFTLIKTAPTDLTSTFKAEGAHGVAPADAWTFVAPLSELPVTDTTEEIYVWIHVATGSPVWNPAPGTLKFTVESPKPTGTVVLGKTSIAFADLAATGDITIDLTGTPAIGVNGKYKISYGVGEAEQSVKGPLVSTTRANAVTHKIASRDLSTIGIPNEAVNAQVTIYPTGTRNGVTVAQLGITVSAAGFSVTPSTLTEIPTTISTLTITPTDDTAWAAAGISAKLTFGANTKAFNLTADAPTHANPGSGRTYTATNIALTGWTGLVDGSEISVYAAIDAQSDNPSYLTLPATITIDLPDPDPTTFTIPATTVKFTTPFNVPKLEVTPTTDPSVNWEALVTSGDLTYRYTVVAPTSNVPAADITGDLIKEGSAGTLKFYLPLQDLAAFELTDALLPKKLVVQISEDGGDTYLAHTEAVTLAKADAPAADFTVTPPTIDLRTTSKSVITVEQKVQDTKWAAKVFLYLSLAKTDTPRTGTLKKEATVTTTANKDTWAIAELTLTEITGIAKDKTVYVYVEHGATATTDGTLLAEPATITITQSADPDPEAAMGVSPLVSLLAALVFLFLKLF